MKLEFKGASITGAEYAANNLPGTLGTDYWYPVPEDAAPLQERGFNLVRIPIRWERIQTALYGDLVMPDMNSLKTLVDGVTIKGTNVLIDLHNYGGYRANGKLFQFGGDLRPEAFADVWERLADAFGQNERVMFGLMNEPLGPVDGVPGVPAEAWVAAANAAIAAIRKHAARNYVVVGGTAWSGAWSWWKDWYGTSNADALQDIEDPSHRTLIEFHQYVDQDYSGRTADCSRVREAVEGLNEATQWLEQFGMKGFLGEFGVPAACVKAGHSMLEVLEAHPHLWAGWCWWAVGRGWPANYPFRLWHSDTGADTQQMEMLKSHC